MLIQLSSQLLFGIAFLIFRVGSQELRNATACSEELLQIVCGSEEVIAVHEAFFNGSDSQGCGILYPINISSLITNRFIDNSEREIRRFSVQSTVNKRCSGLNNCTLLLNDDEPQAKSWGIGKLHIQYNCIAAKSARFSCGEEIEILTPEIGEKAANGMKSSRPSWVPGPSTVSGWGYLQNTGYPEYYRGVQDCRWTIKATHGRRVRVSLLDLSIRSVLHGESSCKDVLTITEGNRLLMKKCGEIEEPLVIESSENELNLTLSVKSEFFGKRGLLSHFTAVGCPTPKFPKQGYLVHGNSSQAEFMCCVDHVFPDTGLRFRNLTCQEGYRWSEDLPDCVEIKHIVESGNQSLIHILRKAQQNLTEPKVGELMNNYSFTFDLIVPASIIGGLIIGNIFIALAVMRCRRQRKNGKDESLPLQATRGTKSQQLRVGTPV